MFKQCSDNPDEVQLTWGSGDRYFVEWNKKLKCYFFTDGNIKPLDNNAISVTQEEMKVLLKIMIPTLEKAKTMYRKSQRRGQPEKMSKVCVISNGLEDEPQTRYEVSTCNGTVFEKYLCWRDDHSIDCTELAAEDLHYFYNLCNS